MTLWISAAALLLGFIVLFRGFRLADISRGVVQISQESYQTIRDREKSDDEKQVALQAASLRLFRSGVLILVGGFASVCVPLGVLWGCDWFQLISLDEVLEIAISPAFLLSSLMVFVVVGRRMPTQAHSYSTADRWLHRIAFSTYGSQVHLSDLEDRIYAGQIGERKIDRPVFVTALPRAGTTMLLEGLANLPEFASHCYRDMPFVLVPCFWNSYSRRFQKDGLSRPRAHGDGMRISYDSAEAFEEIIWKTFWSNHYLKDRVTTWDGADSEEFEEFFRSHMRKIMLLRQNPDGAAMRYLSKNNSNIARLRLLKRMFPDAILLVPFRDPYQHATSLLRQHRTFLELQRKDPFISEYMRSIGHFDFGENLRPIDFDGWFESRQERNADSLAFWLEYWVACYQYLLSQGEGTLCFIDYDRLCRSPGQGLCRLAEVVDCREAGKLLAYAGVIRANPPREIDMTGLSAELQGKIATVRNQVIESALAF
jgi:hypothetical protein